MFKSLKWRLVSIFFLLTMSIVIVIGTFLIYSVENSYKEEFIYQLRQSEKSFAEIGLDENITYETEEYQNELFKVFKYKFVIDNIYRKGYLLDNKANVLLSSEIATQYASDFEKTYITKTANIIKALNGNIGDELDKTKEFLDYAKPILIDGKVQYILYLQYNEEGINDVLSSIKEIIVLSIFFALIVSIFLGYLFAKAITDPITKLTKVSEKMAEGDFDNKVENQSGDEIGTLTNSFNYMAGELQLTLEQRKEFVANVSHELKTPITSIKTYTETLIDGGLEDKEVTLKFLDVINKEADRMARIVSDLLQLSRLDYNQKVWKPENFDLILLARDIISKMRLEADKKQQKIECEIKEEHVIAYADKDGIEQVITNIISNAIKYTFQNGNIKILVEYFEKEPIIKVIDNGIGIPEKDLARVFERFYRVDKGRSREMGGTGLGLSIAKEITEANKGKITIKSETGKGTEVTLTLPKEENVN